MTFSRFIILDIAEILEVNISVDRIHRRIEVGFAA